MNNSNPLSMIAAVSVSWLATASTWFASHISTILTVACGFASLVATFYAIHVSRLESKLRKRQLEEMDRASIARAGKMIPMLAAFVIVAALISGCSTSRRATATTAENVAAAHASTIEKSLEADRIPNVTVSGSSNVVTVAPVPTKATVSIDDAANTKGEASGSTRSYFRASVSTWVAVAAAALAISLLLLAWILWSKLSSSGQAADHAFAAGIGTVETLASHVTGDEAAQALATVRAALEKARGKVTT